LTEFVWIEKGLGPERRIAVVRFDRGDNVNALSPEALRQLTNAARSFEDDGDTSVVILTGGPKAFSAGFDLKDPGNAMEQASAGIFRRLRHVDLSQSALPPGPPGCRERGGGSVAGKRGDLAPPADPLSRGYSDPQRQPDPLHRSRGYSDSRKTDQF
jgi:Enoyl-CoA hydratase/isomerase